MQVDDIGKAEVMLAEDVKQALQLESEIRGGYSPLIHPEVPISVFQKSTPSHLSLQSFWASYALCMSSKSQSLDQDSLLCRCSRLHASISIHMTSMQYPMSGT